MDLFLAVEIGVNFMTKAALAKHLGFTILIILSFDSLNGL